MGRERESPGGFCHLSFAHLEEKNKNAKVRKIERKIDKQRERETERERQRERERERECPFETKKISSFVKKKDFWVQKSFRHAKEH
jgi:hypothetical protein